MNLKVWLFGRTETIQKKEKQMRMKIVNQQETRHLHLQECIYPPTLQIALGCSATTLQIKGWIQGGQLLSWPLGLLIQGKSAAMPLGHSNSHAEGN